MNDLRAITSSALLGTERSPLGVLEHPQLEQARISLESRGSPATLLGVAMLAFNMARAGQPANSSLGSLAPASPDVRAAVPELASARLEQLLDSQKQLLPEWLEMIAQAGYRLPHTNLVQLLNQAQHSPDLRDGIRAVLDSRGQWLAKQNPAWAWAVGDTGSTESTLETWETGSRAARVVALRSLRAEQPAQARALLEAVWKSEVAEERKAFLAEFEAGISSADEPFLESCLDDRSKDVRQIAAGLLAKLPNSAFVERMVARGESLLNRGKKKGLIALSTPELEITLPEWSSDLGRDGIEKKTPYYSGGDKAYWLERIISSIPIETWEIHLRLEPKEILKLLPKDWRNTIQTGFVNAISTYPNPTWIEALLNFDSKFMENAVLMNTLPLEQREKRVRYFIFAKENTKFDWLAWMNHPWSLEFTRECFEWLGQLGQKILAGKNEYHNTSQIAYLANPEITLHWHDPKHYPHWTAFQQKTSGFLPDEKNRQHYQVTYHLEQIKTLTTTLETRAAMRKEILS